MSWFDNAAKSAALRSAGSDDVVEPTSGLTRRDALKKAGIVGGAALWMTPVIQSVLAPAASATGQPACTNAGGTCGENCPSLCNAGTQCVSGADCVTGICTTGTCQPGTTGAVCGTSNANCTSGRCFSGNCALKARGATCGDDAECFSGNCNGGTCGAVTNGNPCLESADCGNGKVCTGGVCANP